MTTVYKKMASGAAWTISYQVASQFISFLSTLILARLLMPDDWEGHPLRKDEPVGSVPVQFKSSPQAR